MISFREHEFGRHATLPCSSFLSGTAVESAKVMLLALNFAPLASMRVSRACRP